MRFRLVPKLSTLDDLELLYVQIFSEYCTSWHVREATTAKRMKIDPHCQWGIVEHWKYFSTVYRLHWYCYVILNVGRFRELRPIYQGCRVLTFALARLSWSYWSCFCKFYNVLWFLFVSLNITGSLSCTSELVHCLHSCLYNRWSLWSVAVTLPLVVWGINSPCFTNHSWTASVTQLAETF